MKTVRFIKDHNYGGHPFKEGDALTLPVDRAEVLESNGVAVDAFAEKKPRKRKSEAGKA